YPRQEQADIRRRKLGRLEVERDRREGDCARQDGDRQRPPPLPIDGILQVGAGDEEVTVDEEQEEENRVLATQFRQQAIGHRQRQDQQEDRARQAKGGRGAREQRASPGRSQPQEERQRHNREDEQKLDEPEVSRCEGAGVARQVVWLDLKERRVELQKR